MAKRGPGKFSTDLDAALYEIALNGADAEVGSSSEPPYTWAGLLRRGPDTARAIEYAQRDSEEAGGGFHDVSKEELDELRRLGKAGVIITENDSGFVEVVYYARESDLEKDWQDCVDKLDADALEPNRSRRRNAKLRDVSSRYGAPMGRSSSKVHGKVTLEQVRVDPEGYDSGGAYWGIGAPLWVAEDDDGNQEFFRARDRKAATEKLAAAGVTVVRSEGRAHEGEDSKLETDGRLAELLEMQAESDELPSEYWGELQITPELSKTASDYETALYSVLSELVKKFPPEGGADANELMDDGDAPYNVYMTLIGSGVGIDDSWGAYYDSNEMEKVQAFIEKRMGGGVGKLETALDNAVYENENRLGVERDDENNVIEREENRGRPTHRRNGQQPWIVILNGEETDIVFFKEGMDADDVKRSLVDHDGYDPRIKVKKRERRRTHAPDAFAENRRRALAR